MSALPAHVHVSLCVGRGQDPVLSFLHVEPGSEIPAIKLGGEWLYPLSHLASISTKIL